MSDLKKQELPEALETQIPAQSAKKNSPRSGAFGRFIRRTLLVVFTLILLAAGGLALFLDTIFTGPSETARNELTVLLLEHSATEWIPGIFLDEAEIGQIRSDEG